MRKKVYDQQFIPLNFPSKDEKIFSMKSEKKKKKGYFHIFRCPKGVCVLCLDIWYVLIQNNVKESDQSDYDSHSCIMLFLEILSDCCKDHLGV